MLRRAVSGDMLPAREQPCSQARDTSSVYTSRSPGTVTAMRALLQRPGLPCGGARLSLLVARSGVRGARRLIELAGRLADQADETLERLSAQTSRADAQPTSGQHAHQVTEPPQAAPPVPGPPAYQATAPLTTEPLPRAPETTAPQPPIPQAVPHAEGEVVLAAEFAGSGAAEGAGAEVHVDEPWHGYRAMRAREVIDRLVAESEEAISLVLLYEHGHRRRSTVISAAQRELSSRQRA